MRKEISCSVSASSLEVNVSRGDILPRIKEDMARQIAASIVELYMIERKNEFSVEFTMNVIVATPEDYWRDVELKALEIRSRFL
jgi:hypothetical protein